jgi:hypothetical protein
MPPSRNRQTTGTRHESCALMDAVQRPWAANFNGALDRMMGGPLGGPLGGSLGKYRKVVRRFKRDSVEPYIHQGFLHINRWFYDITKL